MKGATPEQYRTLADLIERYHADWFQGALFFKTWLLVNASDGLWRIFADGTFEKVRFVDHGFTT